VTPEARLRVAITGATGFVGSNLVARTPPDWQVVAIVRGDHGPAGVTTAPYPADEGPLAPSIESPFDVLIHLAGNSNHGLAETQPWNDVDATARTAALVLGRIQARRVVILSSAAVYAGHVGLVSPMTAVRPAMAYALSKLYVEGLIQARLSMGAIESAMVIRLYNAFGPGERPTRLIPRVATSTGTFTLTGDPNSLSDPVHVDDLVRALIAAAESRRSGTFDFCGGDPVPLARQIIRIGSALGHPARRLELKPREGEAPIQFYSDVAPLCEALGTPRPEPFEDAVRRYGRASGWTA
jgi:nucleoside-diphosphate-sugar epimerase